MMRLLVVLAAAIALLGTTATPSLDATATGPLETRKSLSPVLGISYSSPRGALAWFDPLTLRALPGRKAPLGGHLGSWAFSPDRAVLAIGNCGDAESRGIRFVNARAMRLLGDLRLSLSADCAGSLTWLRPRRLLAVLQTADETSVVLVDPVARRIIRREPLPATASPLAISRTRDELVLLLASSAQIGPARLAVIDSEGSAQLVTVDRVQAGRIVDEEVGARSQVVLPGLAVDPDGRRAFLVPASGPVAEVDLERLSVSYHELDRPSLVQRFMRWLTPSAHAKVIEGPARNARWLGHGMIAVSGMDHSLVRDAQGEVRYVGTPTGLSLIDTGAWTTRMLSREASGFVVAPGLVIALGGRWDSGEERGSGPGVLALSLDGREVWHHHAGEYRWMDPAGSLGYVYISEWSAQVVDLATGLVLATARWNEENPLPRLLAGQVSDW